MLSRKSGVTLTKASEGLDWLPHTTSAAMTSLRKRGYAISRFDALFDGQLGADARDTFRHIVKKLTIHPTADSYSITVGGCVVVNAVQRELVFPANITGKS